MSDIVISGTGVYTPPHVISNEELVTSFNRYVDHFNHDNRDEIASGSIIPLEYSSCSFIEKASGIKQRYVVIKEGILETDRMMPLVPRRPDDSLSITAEMAINASQEAFSRSGRKPEDIDLVIYGASTSERPWPAVSVEIQK